MESYKIINNSETILKLASHHKKLIVANESLLTARSFLNSDFAFTSKETSPSHLIDMCDKIIKTHAEQDIMKANRWIGYIQGVLVAYGIVSVFGLRELYKELGGSNE